MSRIHLVHRIGHHVGYLSVTCFLLLWFDLVSRSSPSYDSAVSPEWLDWLPVPPWSRIYCLLDGAAVADVVLGGGSVFVKVFACVCESLLRRKVRVV